MQIYGLYGKDDCLYFSHRVKELQNLFGEKNLKYLDNCSHNVFVDQQTQFMTPWKYGQNDHRCEERRGVNMLSFPV